jgi:hypothetical protein
MGEGQGWAQERTALRNALLHYLDLNGQPLATRGELRLHVWLHRRRLSWILLPWVLVRSVWGLFLSGQSRAVRASKERMIDLYRQASGMNRQAALDETWRLEQRLMPLIDRPELAGLGQPAEPPAEPPGANRAELEAAADALLAYSLTGQGADDELLREVLALWDEDAMVDTHQRLAQQGITGRRAQERAIGAEAQAWRVQYRLAWRRWWDRQAEQGSPASPGRR